LTTLVGRHVYAIDTVGQPGRSVQREPIADRDALVAWLDEVLERLQLQPSHFVGASYGGWLAINLARRSPEHVATLTLVEPALTRVRPYFWLHGVLVLVASVMPGPIRRRWLRRLHMEIVDRGDPRVVELGRLGLTRYRPGVPRPQPPPTDDELGGVTVPTLVLLAERSELHHARRLATRLAAVMPSATVELLPDAGHSLPVDRAEEVGARLRCFVDQSARA
jgi:pimeloyl-ACP methyl ester carboxylesterase